MSQVELLGVCLQKIQQNHLVLTIEYLELVKFISYYLLIILRINRYVLLSTFFLFDWMSLSSV